MPLMHADLTHELHVKSRRAKMGMNQRGGMEAYGLLLVAMHKEGDGK